MLIVQLLGVVCLFIVFWSGEYKGKSYPIVFWFFWSSLLMACAYVVPLSFIDHLHLPGRELYESVAEWLNRNHSDNQQHYLSIIPYESKIALLTLIAPVSFFFVALSLNESRLTQLVYALLLITTLQASLGLIQYTSGNPFFLFGMPSSGGSAQGTYVNRDHFSALLEMVLPLVIGLLLFSIGRSSSGRRAKNLSRIFNQVLIYTFIALIVFLAAIFAKSRIGVLLIMVAVLLSTIVFSRHIGGKASVGFTAAFATIAIGLSVSIGLIPVLNRFVSKNPVEDERWRIFEHTIQGIKAFFPVGSGPGTFSDIYRAFQPVEQLRFINNAHNDYLELLFEMGAAAVFIIVGFFFLYLFGWFKLAGGVWNRERFIQVGSGIGILMLLLHSSMDFILHEPMNTMVFALLVGMFFRRENSN
ncbi:O-antigen ligase family protein [Leucothrix pacifica]|nr:O-antigen ligase family protein [Leucothrix pacifica]